MKETMVVVLVPVKKGNKMDGYKEKQVPLALAKKMIATEDSKKPSSWVGVKFKNNDHEKEGYEGPQEAESEEVESLKKVIAKQQEKIAENDKTIEELYDVIGKNEAEIKSLKESISNQTKK